MDTREFVENSRGRFMLEIWETTKAPDLGFVRWAVYVELPDLGTWWKLEDTDHYYTRDTAEKLGRNALNWWAKEYQPEEVEE